MKRCPVCQNSFDDSMRFCQLDGALLADEADDISQFGDDATKTLNSPQFGQMPFSETKDSSFSPFDDFSSPNTSFESPSKSFSEPPHFNSNSFDDAQNSYGQPLQQQSSWTPPAPDAGWQSQNIGANTPFAPPVAGSAGQNQTLPIVSLVLGVLGFVLICCWGGVPFGIAALITGFLGMQNAKKDPMNFGGNGLALAGMILGGISLVLSVLFVILGIAGNLLGKFGR